MAILWPRKLPRSVLDEPRRRAEVRVYNRLSEVLNDSFHVFYSSPWLGTDSLGNEKDGECDFLIAHPDCGILAIEVKGGKEISYDPAGFQWRSTDSGNFVHKIKDPVAQARSAKHEILKCLNKSPMWPTRRIHAAHGVIFPGVSAPPCNLGADRPARIFCCASQLQWKLREWISDRMKEGQRPVNCKPLGHDGIAALEKQLAHPFTLSFRIGTALAEADTEFRALEPYQYHVLDCIVDIPRALIQGGAGTGKTVVAIEEAIRSSTAGQKTLLTCHSRPLAINFEQKLQNIQNLTVAGFHSLCGRVASQASISIPRASERELYEGVLPNALCRGMEAEPSLRWDTVIVDEGQDFLPDWWVAIDSCLNDDGKLRVFLDNNQAVYESAGTGVHDLSVVPVRLSRNLRNTRNIHEAALVHYSGPDIIVAGPEGLEVSWINADTPDAKIEIAYRELQRLVFNEEVAPHDIAVLINGPSSKKGFLARSGGTGITFADAEDMTREDVVVVDTVRRFKGLERPAIILVVTGSEMKRRELAYVAFSRARAYLCIVCARGEAQWLSEGGGSPATGETP